MQYTTLRTRSACRRRHNLASDLTRPFHPPRNLWKERSANDSTLGLASRPYWSYRLELKLKLQEVLNEPVPAGNNQVDEVRQILLAGGRFNDALH